MGQATRRPTDLLVKWGQGDDLAMEELFPLIESELHRLAVTYLRREESGHTLQPTALVNEAFLRLIDQQRTDWKSRAHFFGVAAQMMRRILVDHARKKKGAARGGGSPHVSLNEAVVAAETEDADLIALDDAMCELKKFSPRQSRLVELRYFAGLTIAETAEVLKVSPATIKRDWLAAKAWLYGQLRAE